MVTKGSREEALRLAKQYNSATHNTRPEEYWDKVLVARCLHCQVYDISEDEEIPQGNSKERKKMEWLELLGMATDKHDLSKEVNYCVVLSVKLKNGDLKSCKEAQNKATCLKDLTSLKKETLKAAWKAILGGSL